MSFRYWAIVPAAGGGKRMGAAQPKQYLQLLDRTVLEWALSPFLQLPDCAGVVVCVAADDQRFGELAVARDPRVRMAVGGAERADSVRAGLLALTQAAAADDWVLVHDAARPCLQEADVRELLTRLADDPVGGLLATPLSDTVKRADPDQRVAATVSRESLWRPLTPQMFRYGLLLRALELARSSGATVTDEAAAIELLGSAPRLVQGRGDNIKITVADDLTIAAGILAARR